MNTKIARRFFLIPVVYVALIASLLTVEFTGTVRVHEQLSNVTITAVLPARQGGNGRSVQKLDLDMDGFVLSFERQKPLEFRLGSGRSLYASLSGYILLPGALEISFGENLELILHTGNGSRRRLEIVTGLREPAERMLPLDSTCQFPTAQRQRCRIPSR